MSSDKCAPNRLPTPIRKTTNKQDQNNRRSNTITNHTTPIRRSFRYLAHSSFVFLRSVVFDHQKAWLLFFDLHHQKWQVHAQSWRQDGRDTRRSRHWPARRSWSVIDGNFCSWRQAGQAAKKTHHEGMQQNFKN